MVRFNLYLFSEKFVEMLKQVKPLPLRQLFSLEMVSTELKYCTHSYSLKQENDFIYICVKTMPLKFSILMFQTRCLTNVRSFTLKTSDTKEITFLNLQTQNGQSSDKEMYEILVGYQTGEFDIYNIIGDNAKLIQASKQTNIKKKEFLDVYYQKGYNQILIINKNVLTSIEMKHPFRLIREQKIEASSCCELVGLNVATGGNKNINIYETINFNKLRSIPIGCSALKSIQNQQFYVGTSPHSFCWISSTGEIKKQFQGSKNFIENIFQQQQLTWIFTLDGKVTTLKKQTIKELQKSLNSSKLHESKLEQQYSLNDSSIQRSVNPLQQSEINKVDNYEQGKIQIFGTESGIKKNQRQDNNERLHSQESIINELKNDFSEDNKISEFAYLQKVVESGIQSMKMLSGMVLILDNKGILSIREVVKQQSF